MNKLSRDKVADDSCNNQQQHGDDRDVTRTERGTMETTFKGFCSPAIARQDAYGSQLNTIVARLNRAPNRRTPESGGLGLTVMGAAPSDSCLSLGRMTSKQIRCQLCAINCIATFKVKSILSMTFLVNMLTMICLVQAGFWTFYFPNFLKPNGYKELSDIIDKLEAEINSTKDAFSDHQHFWGLLRKMDTVDDSILYLEPSVCLEIFPVFRELAIEYSYIDYEHFIKPLEAYHEHLLECRAKWYPEGATTKNVLPREWEQNLYEVELDLKIRWLSKLAEEEKYREKRAKMVKIWQGVSRGLDTSLECVYLRYAYRQIAADINQFALDMNLKYMKDATEMVRSAYNRIAKLKGEEDRAKQSIADAITKDQRFNIKR